MKAATEISRHGEHRQSLFKQQYRALYLVVAIFAGLSFLFSAKLVYQPFCKLQVNGDTILSANAFAGRGSSHISVERAIEEFLKVPDEASALNGSRYFTSKPHLAGSNQDLETAKDILHLIRKAFNIDDFDQLPIYDAGSTDSQKAIRNMAPSDKPSCWIDTYYPLLNTPRDRSLEIISLNGTSIWSADLTEHADDDTDPDAHKYADAVPTFHGLSKGGTAQGSLVYANYGRKQDYDSLVASGVNFKGKVVIVRYGGIFRGLKVKFAQELGAIAVLIYSDPRDDGSVTEKNGYKPYPHGPARNPTAVQRGSVQFLSMYPGDPTTPGYPSYPNSTRMNAENIPSIPSLPISWTNAERLLREITDQKSDTAGNFVKLVNNVHDAITPIWNTMAVIPGHITSEVIFLGNHRDAWVLGGADPTSGTVSMNEVIKGLGALLRKGWRPYRTIVFASWDAEEYGLVGSTEFGEDFSDWIRDRVVTYINLDSSVSGSRFHSSASPSLADLIYRTAKSIPHPTDPHRSLWNAREDKGPFSGPATVASQKMFRDSNEVSASTGIGALGSGSDYTVFLQRIGVASIDQGFGSTLTDAVYHYHSIYDSQHFQETFADIGFHKHVAIAKHVGVMALRLASEMILPVNITRYAFELDDYTNKVALVASALGLNLDLRGLRKSITGLQHACLVLNQQSQKASTALTRILGTIRRNEETRFDALDKVSSLSRPTGFYADPVYTTLKNMRDKFRETTKSLSTHDNSWTTPSDLLHVVYRVQQINRKLANFEQGFISVDGIKEREWYKHLVTAPGRNLGYGATTFPALTEAITLEHNTTQAEYEVTRLITLITKMTQNLLDKS